MPIAIEKIQSMKAALENIDMSVYRLTDIFFIEFRNVEATQDILERVQIYVVQMSVLISEIKIYLEFMELGIFDKEEHLIRRFELMEEYIQVTETYCEELLKELKMC